MQEPENHTIVGWGAPIIKGARVRVDEWAETDGDGKPQYEHWFEVSEDSDADPISWSTLQARARGQEIYILSTT